MSFRFSVRVALAASALTATAWLAGCGGGGSTDPRDPTLRLLNLSTASGAIDLFLDNERTIASQASGGVSGAVSVNDDTYTLALRRSGGAINLSGSSSIALARRTGYTVVAYEGLTGVSSFLLADDDDDNAPGDGATRLRVLHAAPQAGPLDVHVSDSCPVPATFDNTTLLASGLAAGAVGAFADAGVGTLCVRVTGKGTPADLRLVVPAMPLAGGQTVTLVLTAGAGGVLVDATRLVQGGAASPHANNQARLRLAAGADANGVVALTLGGEAVATGTGSPNLAAYQRVAAGTGLAATVTLGGTNVPVGALTLAPGADYTLLVAGTATAPVVQLLTDDNRLPADATQAKMRLVHGAGSASAEAVSLSVASAVRASTVAYGTSSAYGSVTGADNQRLTVSTPTSPTLYEVAEYDVVANTVYSVLVLGGNATPTVLINKDR